MGPPKPRRLDEPIAAIDALDTRVSGGPDRDNITLESYGREILEA